jgi:hypothetical protein
MAVTITASYQETLTNIEDTVRVVPGFMKAVPLETNVVAAQRGA